MTYLDAAIRILRTARRPLTAREITEEAVREGFIRPTGKTPEATMSAALYIHIRDADKVRVRRDFEPGAKRAARGTVRWRYVSGH